jgi:hypothetical protein
MAVSCGALPDCAWSVRADMALPSWLTLWNKSLARGAVACVEFAATPTGACLIPTASLVLSCDQRHHIGGGAAL